jgi:methylmalonyl-CoA mutase N-terminal domain/subunit
MPALIDAIEAGATQGELIGALIEVYGAYRPPAIF